MVLIKIEALKNKILTLEKLLREKKEEIKAKSDEIKEHQQKYKRLREQYDYMMDNRISESEFQNLKLQNSKLLAELNSLKRGTRQEDKIAKDKLKEIQRILNYNPKAK
jgi:soluble cytochrome b562